MVQCKTTLLKHLSSSFANVILGQTENLCTWSLHLQPVFVISHKINNAICFGAGNQSSLHSRARIQQMLLNVLFILFQNGKYHILDKSLQNENNRCFNTATVQPNVYLSIFIVLLVLPIFLHMQPIILTFKWIFYKSLHYSQADQSMLRNYAISGLNRVVKNNTKVSPIHVQR